MAVRLSLRQLQWLTIVVAILFLVLVQGVAMGVVMPTLGRPYGHAVSIIGFSVGIIVLATILYSTIERMQARIVRQNEESEALYEIAVDIAALDNEREVLRSIVDRAREMLHADAAAICLRSQAGGVNAAARTGNPDAFRQPSGAEPETVLIDGCPLVNPDFFGVSEELLAGDERLGEICVSWVHKVPFDNDARRLLRAMGDLAAIEVQKGRLLERDRLVAALEERERLAREMHDSLAQVLGYLHLKSQAAELSLAAGDGAKVKDALDEITSVSQEAYVDVREAIHGLRGAGSRRGFVEAVREYAGKFSLQSGVKTHVEVTGAPLRELDPAVEHQLMRVVQEALTNVRKHASASTACVNLDQGDALRITIEDDGSGFNPELTDDQQDHYGLFSMRERVEQVGGQMEIDSMVGRGTRICVVFSNGKV